MKHQPVWMSLGLLSIISIVIGAVFAVFSGVGEYWIGWLSASSVTLVLMVGLFVTWRWAGGGRTLAWMIVLAFGLRFGIGIAMYTLLPSAGYDTPTQNAGYVFFDAFHRDQQAWGLAKSDQPLWAVFEGEYATDQYGGLLATSMLAYRYLSPDAHRPLLIVLIAAGAAAFGLPFFWKAVNSRWGAGVAIPAGWILALYPESIHLGSSQMREPFLITFIAMAFWAALCWRKEKLLAAGVLVVSLLGLLTFSIKVALPVLGVNLVWLWLDWKPQNRSVGWQKLSWVILAAACLGMGVLTWAWFRSAVQWDAYLTFQSSGMVQYLVRTIGEGWLVPFVTGYGLAQPVLPAAVTDNGLLIWRITSSLLALGWYALAPLLVYGFITAWKVNDPGERRTLVWLGLVVWIWILISSARAGGDQWDNPRYRTIFLVWLALFAGWAWDWARTHRDAWLSRWLMVEAIFVGCFIYWYTARNVSFLNPLPFGLLVAMILGLSGVVLVGGWLWDRRKQRQIMG